MGKLFEHAALDGGIIKNVNLIDSIEIIVEEGSARLPSYYRALAVAQDAEWTKTQRVARTTVSAPGTSVAGEMRTRAPVDTAEPVVQKYKAEDGEWRRSSTSESAWSTWRTPIYTQALGGASGSETVDLLTTNPTISHTQPKVYFVETDQVAPAGLWYAGVVSDRFVIARKTGATYTDFIVVNSSGEATFTDDIDLNSGRVYRVNGTQVVKARITGWTATAAAKSRVGYNNFTVTASGTYQQSEVQAISDRLTVVQSHLAAVIEDLIAHGLIGT